MLGRIIKRSLYQWCGRNSAGLVSLGTCKSLKITCLSQKGWFDNAKYEQEGLRQKHLSLWQTERDTENSAGVSNLVEVELLSGKKVKFLQDCGWRHSYMDKVYTKFGVDKMIRSGEIEFLFVTHEHLDHFGGVPMVIKHNPLIPLYIPPTFSPEAHKYLLKESFPSTAEPNNIQRHRGYMFQLKENKFMRLTEGMGATFFDFVFSKIRGEGTIFANVEGKGLVILTGCCHYGILNVLDYARKNIEGGDKVYGLYGGLHLAPYGKLLKGNDEVISKLAKLEIPKVAANHCTGQEGVEVMLKKGVNLVKGSSSLMIDDGDIVEFQYSFLTHINLYLLN